MGGKESFMDNQLFRKKTIERISSPEQLRDYMRVTSPRLWMILSAIVALLLGFIAYASTATMESTLSVKAEVIIDTFEDGTTASGVSIALSPRDKDIVQPGMVLRLAGKEGKISFILQDGEEVLAFATMDDETFHLPAGTYDAEIVTETTTPIRFLLN